MTTLAPTEYELLLDCIRQLHSLPDLPSLRTWLLDSALPRLLPSDWLAYNEVDLQAPEKFLALVRPENKAIWKRLQPVFAGLAHQHPLIIRQMHSENFPVHKISDFLSQDEFHQLELYQEFYRHLEVEYQIALTIRMEPARVTAFALSRRDRDYTESDRTILELLRPHLVVAFNRFDLIGHFKLALADDLLAFNQLAASTIIINPQGRILYHAGPGLHWLGATSPGFVPAEIIDWVKSHPPDASGQTRRWTRAACEIVIRAVPTANRERLLLVLTLKSEGALAPKPHPPGLTKREKEVAHWISEGKTNAEIAVILGISPRTVDKHIEHIYERFEVESRGALTVRLLKPAG